MNGLFLLAISVHVVTSILGLGQIVGTAILASAQRGAGSSPATLDALRRLGRGTTWALVLMLLSGVLLEYACGGCFHQMWWFRVSFFLLLALGALQGRIRVMLRVTDVGSLRRISHLAWGMCAIVAVVAVLMEVKPW